MKHSYETPEDGVGNGMQSVYKMYISYIEIEFLSKRICLL